MPRPEPLSTEALREMAKQPGSKTERRLLWEISRLRKVVQEAFESLEEVNAMVAHRDGDLQEAVRRVYLAFRGEPAIYEVYKRQAQRMKMEGQQKR
jgi:hypothetical protein